MPEIIHWCFAGVGVGAADDIHVVFTRTGGGEQGIAAPDGPCDDFGAFDGEGAGDFGEEAVVADHHADLAKAGVEHGIVADRG
jgi:hypothetical protein